MTGGHYPASFDNKTREIRVHQTAADRAAKGGDDSWELVTVLLHEFGHYIDAVLRQDLAPKNADGTSTLKADADLDEGAKYAYEIAFYDFAGTSETVYAQYSSPNYSGPLKVKYNAIRQAIRKAQDEDAQRREGKGGDEEYFGAGRGEHHKERPNSSFGHQSIEEALRSADGRVFNTNALKLIYFGNWLRDFSQVVDPAIVRKPGAPKNFPRAFSRVSLTEIVDVLGEADFVEHPRDRETYRVTQELLGVYRPVEHIDNPTNNDASAPDPQSIDAAFQPKPSAAYVAVDPATAMKRYIPASRDYMKAEIGKAAAAGPNAAGFRHLGAGLHVLEDYFAHSNFIELSLIKAGYKGVLPWTSPVQGAKHPIPVVTGMFDKDDVIASTAGLIADLLFKVEWEYKGLKPGERTKADRIMLILLREHSTPYYLDIYKQYLLARDGWLKVPGHEYADKALHYTFGMIGNVYNFVYSSLLKLVGESVDDQQVVRTGNPNTNGSTNPTHSQLAKDHDTHPFHVLAATLAKYAVQEVGTEMADRWTGRNPAADPASVAAAFLVHPNDCHWQDKIVADWARRNPAQLKRGESATEWEALEKAHKKEVLDTIANAGKASRSTWKYVTDYFDDLFK
nr:HET-C-related protein [Pseudoduganella lurida]